MTIRKFFAVGVLLGLAACGTPYQATDSTTLVVPAETQRMFAQQYPSGVNAVWSNYDPAVIVLDDWELSGWQTMDASDYVVTFDMDNQQHYAWYDSDGTWIGTALIIRDFNSLPSNVNVTITRDFPSYTILSVNREYHKDKIAYEVVVRKDESKVVLLVDSDGRIIKQKTKS